MKLTPVFPAHIKPVRPGVYRTDYYGKEGYSYWSGHLWGCEQSTPGAAEKFADYDTAEQSKKWRGIAK